MLSRKLATLPISVGTGLAIEALVKAPLAKYSSFLINMLTLVRNAIDAYEGELPKPNTVAEAVSEDMKGIAEALSSLKITNSISLIYYYPSYSGLKREFPLANLKVPKTAKQIERAKLVKEVMDKVYDKYKKVIIKNDVKLPIFNGQAIIITHHPVDLATAKGFTRLTLLESNTGMLKSFPYFYTKLTGGDKLGNIPLNKITIQIFGDNAVDFYAVKNNGVKQEIKELADLSDWSSSSTPSFVYSSIKNLNNSPNKATLLKMI